MQARVGIVELMRYWYRGRDRASTRDIGHDDHCSHPICPCCGQYMELRFNALPCALPYLLVCSGCKTTLPQQAPPHPCSRKGSL